MNPTASFSAVITDSGLGGMSVFAGVVAGVKAQTCFDQISLTYVNAWPMQNSGYNQLPDMTERARVFDCALRSMMTYEPDLIVIACHTLSVIYPYTPFGAAPPIGVLGIVTAAVESITRVMTRFTTRPVVLFGTPITIEAGLHAEGLRRRGIASGRIFEQACPRLAGEINRNPDSARVADMIDACTARGASRLDRASAKTGIVAGLCCTHYGYRAGLFARRLAAHSGVAVEMVNPNEHLVTSVLSRIRDGQAAAAKLNLRVVSKVAWEPRQIDQVARHLEKQSPESAGALRNWEHRPELFTP